MNEISDQELLEDIENTKREMEAYSQIAISFQVLANLPEKTSQHNYYLSMYREYRLKESSCSDFLNKLYKIKKDREEHNHGLHLYR